MHTLYYVFIALTFFHIVKTRPRTRIGENRDTFVKNDIPLKDDEKIIDIEQKLGALRKETNKDTNGLGKAAGEAVLKVDSIKLAETIRNANALPVDKLEPEDHMDGVRMEQDGMLNKDFKKEIFVGNHEEIDDDQAEVAEGKLKDIFYKADTDKDGQLSVGELESWIMDRVQEHFNEAREENAHIFKHLDPDGDEKVDWKEYYIHFLLAKGHPLDRATKHVQDYDEIDLNFEEREQLIRYKFKWTDADTEPMDNKLTKEEFFAFRHPEQSNQTLMNMVSTIMDSLDKNGDGILTEEEFVSLPGEMEDEEQQQLDKDWQEDRRKEYQRQIDKDRNGKVTKEELMKYLDPKNPEQARSDAEHLVEMIDDSHDKLLSWEEILNHKDVFINSKVVNVRRMLHDEF